MSFDYRPNPYNLCVRDSYTDNGSYSAKLNGLNSPDIIIRDRLDTDTIFVKPVWASSSSKINYVNVRVTNKGWQTFNPSSNPVYVEAYWSSGGPISCKADYIGKNKNSSGNAVGGMIGSVLLDRNLAPGETVTVQIPWRYANYPSGYMGTPLNILATVGAKNEIDSYDNYSHTNTYFPNIAERHFYCLSNGSKSEKLRFYLPLYLPEGVDFRLLGGAAGYDFYVCSNELFGDEDLHFFNSENNVSNVLPSKKAEYIFTFGYSSQPMILLDNIQATLQIINRKDGNVLGSYTMMRAGISSGGFLNIEEKSVGIDKVELTASMSGVTDEVEYTWLNCDSKVVGNGEVYRGTRADIDGGILICQTYEGYAEMPVELHTDPYGIIVTERFSDRIVLSKHGEIDEHLTIEMAFVGENTSVTTEIWPDDAKELTLSMPENAGMIVVTAICGDERHVVERMMLNR